MTTLKTVLELKEEERCTRETLRLAVEIGCARKITICFARWERAKDRYAKESAAYEREMFAAFDE